MYFVLFIALVSAVTPKTDDSKKSVNDLIKEIADTEAKRIQLKVQTQQAQNALRLETMQMAKEHKVRMNRIAQLTKELDEKQHLRETAKDAEIARIRANDTLTAINEQAAALKKYTQEHLADIENKRKLRIRDKIDAEKRRQALDKLKSELEAKQRRIEDKYKRQREKEEHAFTAMREKMWSKFDMDRKARKDAMLQKELNMRKMQDMQLEKFRTQLELERRMKRLTIAETQRQLFNLRKTEEIKREIIREGLKYKKLLEEQKMKKAEEKAKMIEDLKDQAVKLMIEKENLIRIRHAEAKQLSSEVATVKKEIAENAKITQRAIATRAQRKAAIRKAKIAAERNRMRFLKIRSLRMILAKRLVAEKALYNKKVIEAKKLRELERKTREQVRNLTAVASHFDKQSIEVLKSIQAQKKAIELRRMLQDKVDELSAKRALINNFKLKLQKLQEDELKHQMKLSGVNRDILNQKTLSRIIQMRIDRTNRRNQRIAELKKKLDKMFIQKRDLLLKKRCVAFRKLADKKQQEEERKNKIACLLSSKARRRNINKSKCFDFVHQKYQKLVQKTNHLGCGKNGMKNCEKIELP